MRMSNEAEARVGVRSLKAESLLGWMGGVMPQLVGRSRAWVGRTQKRTIPSREWSQPHPHRKRSIIMKRVSEMICGHRRAQAGTGGELAWGARRGGRRGTGAWGMGQWAMGVWGRGVGR